MKRQETQQFISTGKEGKRMVSVDAFSPDQARDYAKHLFRLRVRGWGDETRALEDCASMSRMTPISFKRLMAGKTKEPTLGVFGRVRKAYLDCCAREAAKLMAIVAAEEARTSNVHVQDIGDQVSALVARIEAARTVRIKERKGP